MRSRVFAVVVALLSVVACTEATGVNLSNVPGYMISAVQVSPSVDTIFVADPIRPSDRITFSATATGKNGATLPSMTFAWSTSDPFVATVDSAGVVTPKSLGVVEISASADKVGRATLVILPATMTVSISPLTDTILVTLPIVPDRDTTRLVASARDMAGVVMGGASFTWTSSSPSVATVDANGLVHALSIGVATISASSNGHFASAVVHVIAAPSGSG